MALPQNSDLMQDYSEVPWRYKKPLCFQSAGRQKTPTMRRINERSVCAFPLSGNPVTGTAAAQVFLDSQLFALSGCQLPTMPCTNYWLRIDLSHWPEWATPHRPRRATHTQTAQETSGPLCGYFKETTLRLVATGCTETQQTKARSSRQSPSEALSHIQTHIQTLFVIFLFSFWPMLLVDL